MAGRSLQITYLGDAKSVLAAQGQIDAGHSRLQGGAQKTGSFFQRTFGSVIPGATLLSVAGIGLLAKTVVDAATREGEAQNQVNVIFGQSAKVVSDFADTSASAFGISRGAALEAAGGFGAMLKSAGLAKDAAAQMSVSIVGLAGDLASFKNVAPEEALEKLRSGLAGEAEPLRQFGVFLSEAAVKAEAYKSGIATVGEELTEAEKVQARYNIILDQTKDAHGDFGETLGQSLPNQMRQLTAELTDLAADFGTLLLPALTLVVKALGAVADNAGLVIAALAGFAAFKYLPDLFLKMALGLEAVGLKGAANATAGLGGFVGALGKVAGPIGVAIVAGQLLNDTLFGTDQSAEEAGKTLQDTLNNALLSGKITVDEYQAAVKRANEQGDGFVVVQDQSAQVLGKMEQAAGVASGATDELTAAERENRLETEALEDAHRALQLTILAATDSFLGISVAADDLAEAQREVNRLQEKGKEDTKAYDEAVMDVLTSQLSLEDALISYAQELDDAGVKQGRINREIREAGAAAGLTKGEVNELIVRIQALISKGEEWDGREFRATITATPNYPPGFVPRFQHGGIVTRPTVALIGEAGPEAVVPLSRHGGAAGLGTAITINVAGNVISEYDLAETIRETLVRIGHRNPDIFGGRA